MTDNNDISGSSPWAWCDVQCWAKSFSSPCSPWWGHAGCHSGAPTQSGLSWWTVGLLHSAGCWQTRRKKHKYIKTSLSGCKCLLSTAVQVCAQTIIMKHYVPQIAVCLCMHVPTWGSCARTRGHWPAVCWPDQTAAWLSHPASGPHGPSTGTWTRGRYCLQRESQNTTVMHCSKGSKALCKNYYMALGSTGCFPQQLYCHYFCLKQCLVTAINDFIWTTSLIR